jgi:DNA-directed RNA polymerase subunit RPC12/RpoP
MNANSCSRCHGDTELTIIGFADGEADSLRIRLKDLPLLTCAEGHRQFVRAQFPAELLEHLTQQEEPELPTGEKKGFILKHYLCEDCGAELEPKPDHRHSFSFDVKLDDLDAFGVELTMPVYKCSACAHEQLHSLDEVRKLTPKALAQAFDAADIPPPPGQL